MKVQKWIDTPDLKRNEKFIIDWHYFLKEITARLREQDGENISENGGSVYFKKFLSEALGKRQGFL